VLDVLAVDGWTPPATGPGEEPASAAFARPAGLSLTDEVAQGMAKSIASVLPNIPDDEQPFSDYPFGEHHTEDVLSRRAAGEPLVHEDSAAAYELLSGPAKAAVERLGSF